MWPFHKHYDHDAEREKFLNSIPTDTPQQPHKIAVQENPAKAEESAMSFLSAVGKDFKAVFSWLGSSKGQATIAATEGLAESAATVFGAGAVVQAGITIVNSWMQKIITTETLAAAAGQQTGSSAQKAGAVLAAISPELSQYFPKTTAAQAQAINDALVLVLNTLGEAQAATSATAA